MLASLSRSLRRWLVAPRLAAAPAPAEAPSPGTGPTTPEGLALLARVRELPFWFHSIDLGLGVVTPGAKSPDVHRHELATFRLPDLRGKSVLDIGAWDGFYSFAAERLGASRVVALDHYIWAMDWLATLAYRARCKQQGAVLQPYNLVPEVWRWQDLPGKRPFDLAHAALNS